MKTILRFLGAVITLVFFIYFSLSGNPTSNKAAESKGRSIKPGWIGVMVQDLNEKLARKAKLESPDGAYVKEVLDGSPADSAGILEGDVIVEFNSKKIYDTDDLIKVVRRTLPNTKINLIVIREGKKNSISLTIGRAKTPKYPRFGLMYDVPEISIQFGRSILGLKLITLNEQLGEYFSAPNNEGVLVEEVEKDSEAGKAGFKAGDVIVRIGKKTITDVNKVKREIQKYEDGEKVEFEILRKGVKKTLNVELEGLPAREDIFLKHFRKGMFHINPHSNPEAQFDFQDILPEFEKYDIELEGATVNKLMPKMSKLTNDKTII